MKKWALLIVLLLALFAGAWFGSAYLAASRFKDAAISADADRLEAAVDFPAVRNSLKPQLSAVLMRKFQSDPHLKGNLFAGLGMLLGPALVDKAVDAFVTPDAIAAVIKGERPEDGAAHARNPDVRYSHMWVDTDHFSIHVTAAASTGEGPTLLFERRGLFNWKLVKLGLPGDFLNGRTASIADDLGSTKP